MIEHGHKDSRGELNGAAQAVDAVPPIESGIMLGTVLDQSGAFRQVVIIDLCRSLTLREIDERSDLIEVENPVIILADEPSDVVLMGVSRNNVLQNAVGAVLIDVIRDGTRGALTGARVDENIDVASFDEGTIARVVIAELEEMHVEFNVRILDDFRAEDGEIPNGDSVLIRGGCGQAAVGNFERDFSEDGSRQFEYDFARTAFGESRFLNGLRGNVALGVGNIDDEGELGIAKRNPVVHSNFRNAALQERRLHPIASALLAVQNESDVICAQEGIVGSSRAELNRRSGRPTVC